ncbi:MAG TPA: aspartate/glutamate racemase family protein [Clostridia bacterium]|nr:aspartate/glutamate racemase family protein [Clostridia bacterium]
MKTIGLIGGMSYESTVTYYNVINSTINNTLGKHHSAKILMYSVDFEEIYYFMQKKDWDNAANILIDAARKLEKGGADFILICTNTLHLVYDKVQQSVSIPLLHIADALIGKLKRDKVDSVLLLGTKTTMLQHFYTDKLSCDKIQVLLPSVEQMDKLDGIIFDELCVGNINEKSKKELLSVMSSAMEKGVKACVFGCTELGLLVSKNDTDLPVYDTAIIHAMTAADMAVLQ